MKNINTIISRLSRSGLLSRTARGPYKKSLGRVVTDTVIAKATGKSWPKAKPSAAQTGALATVGRVAWDAYQAYSSQAYGRSSTLHRGNLQRAYQLGLHAQRATAQKTHEPRQPYEQQSEPSAAPQSRYIPATTEPSLTYSPASLSQRQFEQVVQDEGQDSGQILLLQAMIAAANADGHIDENERQLIYQQVDDYGLSTTDKARLFDELRRPLSLAQLVKSVPNIQTAIEVYAASLLAIDEKQPSSQTYLSGLASALRIPAELVSALHAQVEQV